ncbi:MAG: hypothetical protein AB7L09_21585 [Nitrospira sp.]
MPARIDEYGHIFSVSATFTRPSDTTAYAIGDLIANDVDAGDVVPLSLQAARIASGGFIIRAARLWKSTTTLTAAAFRAHLFSELPVPSAGDNAAFNSSGVLGTTKGPQLIGSIDFTMDRAGSDGAIGFGTPSPSPEILFNMPDNFDDVYALIEARGAYAPGSAEIFGLELTGLQT